MTSLDMIQVPAALRAPDLQARTFADPIRVDLEQPADVDAREALLDRAFGPTRFAKTCERLRAGRLPAGGLSLVARRAESGGDPVSGPSILGTVRLWHVDAGGVAALMLGPLAVDAHHRCDGIGARLMEAAIARATALGHAAIILVGDAPYYARFGFARTQTLGLRMPGAVEAERFLGLELRPRALAGARGLVRATGAIDLGARRRRQKPKLPRAA